MDKWRMSISVMIVPIPVKYSTDSGTVPKNVMLPPPKNIMWSKSSRMRELGWWMLSITDSLPSLPVDRKKGRWERRWEGR